MKHFFIILTLLQSIGMTLNANDSSFRFTCLVGATTSRPYEVTDAKGKVTTVVLTKDSDSASMAILNALIRQQGISGSRAPKKHSSGITWDQGIVLIGSFVSEPKKLPNNPNGAPEGPFREFKITKINVMLPFARWVAIDPKNPVDTPYVIEFHLELRSLVPEGIIVNGKPLDLKKYETTPPKSE